MARRCPDGRWSAVQSSFPEDCVAHMNVSAAIVLLLFFMVAVLGICIWFKAADWDDRDKEYCYTEVAPFYGSTTKNGRKFDVYCATNVRV